LKHSGIIRVEPASNHFAVAYFNNVASVQLDALVGRRDSGKVALMRAPGDKANRDGISTSDCLFHFKAQIRKRPENISTF
jgi:hypothetical protein